MSQFHNLFRKVVGEKDAAPVEPVEDRLESIDKSYGLREVPSVQIDVESASRLVFLSEPMSPGSERFRLLRMRLKEQAKSRKVKILLITSPLPHDGKSTVALNLATALAEKGKQSVLVVEGDLHHPHIVERLGLNLSAGFGECLERQIEPLAAIRRIEPLGWYLLPAGAPRLNATELLQTAMANSVLRPLARHFDWVLIDSPPALPLTDAVSLRHHADACLLIVRADATPRESVEEAVKLIGKQHILGIVLNGVEGLQRLYSKYGYYRR